MANRSWVAAVGAEFRDEDILLKRRSELNNRSPKGKGKEGKDGE